MQYLIAAYRIRARLAITIHDEVRYLVAEVDALRAALALQIANLWVRSIFAYRVGIDDLPNVPELMIDNPFCSRWLSFRQLILIGF